MPEANENLEEGNKKLMDARLTYYLSFLTYSLILFVEKVAFNSHALIAHDHDHGHHHGEDEDEHEHEHEHEHQHEHEHEHQHQHEHEQEDNKMPLVPEGRLSDGSAEDNVKNLVTSKGQMATYMYKRNELENEGDEKQEKNESYENSYKILNNIVKEEEKETGVATHDHHHPKPGSSFTPFILLIALSLHGFFEGVALGISGELQGVLFLVGAICAHKWAESLTLGISFIKANTPAKTFVLMCFIFSLFGPLGVFLGLCLSSLINSPVVTGIFLGISSGTFLYVACSEVIVEEFAASKYKYQKFGLYLFGAILCAVLALIELFTENDEEE